MTVYSLAVLLLIASVVSYGEGKPRRVPSNIFYVKKTVGEPWPKPQSIQTTPDQWAVHPATFHFIVNATGQTCDLLTSALDRYFRLIFFPKTYLSHILHPTRQIDPADLKPKKSLSDLEDVPFLKRLNVYVKQPCERYPNLESDESCKRTTRPLSCTRQSTFSRSFLPQDSLRIDGESGQLSSVTLWGALRGLETFSHIVYTDDLLGVSICARTGSPVVICRL